MFPSAYAGRLPIFKWNETDIKVSEVLKLTDQKPIFGHKSGKRANTPLDLLYERDITMKQLLYIDLFCGAGGTSTGVNSARLHDEPCADVIACVNHDAKAIASHAANHPNALHFTEDIRTLELSPLISHIAECRKDNPEALIVLWASLECTNFSKAKGGQPRDADSRTLAEHLFRYIEAIDRTTFR